MKERVVVTGMGVVAPNGVGIETFHRAIKEGKSGIKFIDELATLGLKCNIGGIPNVTEDLLKRNLPNFLLNRIEASNILYGLLAGMEAWKNSGRGVNKNIDWEAGVIMGMQTVDGNFSKSIVEKVYNDKIRKLSGRTAEQAITSSLSAYLSGYLGLGNCAISNSSACATGTESIYMAYKKISNGEAECILAGSTEGNSPFIWSTLDRLRALNSCSNNKPTKASRPMSSDAKGFVPSSGAGALVLETLKSAKKRKTPIYAEIVGGANNCGGQRNGGSMTTPNITGIENCIKKAILDAKINENQIDLISGHLTATYADPIEIEAWVNALNRNCKNFPYINSLKSMTGHCLAAAGSIESVAVVLQLFNSFIHPSINCNTVHPEILKLINPNKIPSKLINKNINYVAKANFGFGDINTCLIFKKQI